jgi:catechol 2,3-dioxygenase-like lactoylglutathione lyase family enzyme
MKRVIGLGGIFFKSKDPVALRDWYEKHLGIVSEEWGTQFFPKALEEAKLDAYQVWSPFRETTTYLEPSEKPYMINFIVDDLFTLLDALRTEGVHVFDMTEDTEFGKFGWILDPDGTKIELWQPPLKS